MIKLAIVILSFAISGVTVNAESSRDEQAYSPVILSDLTLVELSAVSPGERIAILNGKAIVKKQKERAASALASTSGRNPLVVIQDPQTGRYGISDGGIIVRVHVARDLADIASDYGLNVKHAYSALPMGVLLPSDITKAPAYISALREDARVASADLDANYYDKKAQ